MSEHKLVVAEMTSNYMVRIECHIQERVRGKECVSPCHLQILLEHKIFKLPKRK